MGSAIPAGKAGPRRQEETGMDIARPHGLTTAPAAATRDATAKVRAWLYLLAVLVLAMTAVGGATRLTGSGLSITEWKPVTGAVPPLSDVAWAAEFDKYRASSQYRNLNQGMELGEFQFIYWWEWSHRQLGRLIGIVFALPLVAFWWTGAIRGRLALTILGAGVLGGLQATVGWIMVASGLEAGMTAVAPVKLMLHLTLAALILALLVGVATSMRPRPAVPGQSPAVARLALGFAALVLVQIALGGLVAGSRAGYTYNTWPLMDGRLVPAAESLFAGTPWLENFIDNPLTVQFQHRLAAYAVAAFAFAMAFVVRRRHPASRAGRRATVLAGMVVAQMALGIATLLLVVPLWAGLAHQLLAMAILAMAVVHWQASRAERPA